MAGESVIEVETVAGPLLLPREDRMITRVLRTYGVWEPAESRFLLSTLRPGQTFVDVGAHVGYFSVLAAKRVGSTGSVLAVEPEARNLRLLRRNLRRNGCTNAVVLPFAAHSAPGRMSLALDEENRGGHRLVPLGEAETTVRCVRLDDVLPARVDFVKIDAQGYDHEVIEGLELTLAANPQAIVIAELSLTELGRRGVKPEAVLDHYTALGLTIATCDTYGRLRRASGASVVEEAREGRLTTEISLVLQRPPSFSGTERYPKKAGGLEVTETRDRLVVVDPTLRRTHQLNPTASVVFVLCNGENTVARIVELVREAYDLAVSPRTEVEQCVAHLRSEGLVV